MSQYAVICIALVKITDKPFSYLFIPVLAMVTCNLYEGQGLLQTASLDNTLPNTYNTGIYKAEPALNREKKRSLPIIQCTVYNNPS